MTYISSKLRREVIERAGNCCEYCLLNQEDIFFKFEIHHIIAEKHNGSSESDNLCLSCPDCDAFKGSDIGSIDTVTGKLTPLFNPREQSWNDHFQLNQGAIEPKTAEGRVTVFLLRLNKEERVIDRLEFIKASRYPCENINDQFDAR